MNRIKEKLSVKKYLAEVVHFAAVFTKICHAHICLFLVSSRKRKLTALSSAITSIFFSTNAFFLGKLSYLYEAAKERGPSLTIHDFPR